MKKSIVLFFISLLCSTISYTQTINNTLYFTNSIGGLTREMLEDCKPVIEKKLNKFCEAIEFVGSYDENITVKQKRHRRDEIKSLFFKYDYRYMTVTSKRHPGGQSRKLREYFNNLIIQSNSINQPIYMIDKVDVTLTSNKMNILDSNAWRLVGIDEEGIEVYETTVQYIQEYYVKSKQIRIGNLETHEPPQTHVLTDVDTKFVRVYLILSPKTEGNGYNVLIRLGDIYASILE